MYRKKYTVVEVRMGWLRGNKDTAQACTDS